MRPGHGQKKSRKQEQLIAALLSHPTIEAASKSIGIADTTAARWMKTPEFQVAYREARREAMRRTTARLQSAASEAVDALCEITRSGEGESARVSAAKCILDSALKAVDLDDIQQRLDAIERAIKSKH